MEPLEPFYNVTANVYYPGSNTTWTSANMLNYGGNLTWIAEGQRQPDSRPTGLQIVPEVTDEVYVIGSAAGAVIKCTGELKDFVSIAIDDVVLAPSDYTAVSGSTVVTILSSYLDKLSLGRHKVTLNYTYGEETNLPWIVAVMAFCIGSLCSIKYQNRKFRS